MSKLTTVIPLLFSSLVLAACVDEPIPNELGTTDEVPDTETPECGTPGAPDPEALADAIDDHCTVYPDDYWTYGEPSRSAASCEHPDWGTTTRICEYDFEGYGGCSTFAEDGTILYSTRSWGPFNPYTGPCPVEGSSNQSYFGIEVTCDWEEFTCP